MAEPRRSPEPLPDRQFDPWNFRPEVAGAVGQGKLAGLKLEAIDGRVGTVVDASLVENDSYLVVTLGRWLFGKRAQLPAGTVTQLDRPGGRIRVDRTRSQVTGAPPVPAEAYDDPAHRSTLARYYEGTYRSSLQQ